MTITFGSATCRPASRRSSFSPRYSRSIVPTVQFLGWRKAVKAGQVPALDDARRRRIRMIIHIELTLLFLIMLCAALTARGIGFIG